MERKAYPTDVSDAEWALVAPYLSLMTEETPQRDFPLREVFNGLRWIVRSGSSWRLTPHDPPCVFWGFRHLDVKERCEGARLKLITASKLDFVHSEIGARAGLRMDKVTFNC